MTTVQNKNNSTIKNDNLKNLKPMRGSTSASDAEVKSEVLENEKSSISNAAKNLSNQSKK